MKPTNEMIAAFFETKKIAVAGVSRNEKKFGAAVFTELKGKGFDVLPVNPHADEIYGVRCYPSIAALPNDINSLLLVTPKKSTLDMLKEAVAKGIKNIWIQQMSETPETIEFVKSFGSKIIMKQCVLMHAAPVKGFHKFHRNIYKFFGFLPK
jgi:uncharacterized protein